ncbi:hypothetical protein VP01_4106g1, partial [Puccinia sorghi]
MPKKASPKPTKKTTKKPAIQRKSKKNRGSNSYEDSADKTAGHLNKEDYLVIIGWLKIERNYNSCFGTGNALAVGCSAKDKPDPLSDEELIQYTKTSTKKKAGISTIDEKLESMCPHYHAMYELIGGQAFINPLFQVDGQAENKLAKSSPSEPSGNEIRSSDMGSNNNDDKDVVISGDIHKQAERNLADETNK